MGGNKLPMKGRDRFDWEKQQQLFWYDRYHTAMTSLAYSFQKTDRILTGNLDITVKAKTSLQNGMNFPGFTMGNTITLNYDKFKNIGSASTLVALMGLNYHELSHWLFTPKTTTKLRQWMFAGNDRDLFIWWNILEDQRIESLFRAIYSPAGKHFTQMVIEFILNDKDNWPLGYAMVYGRKFVPLEIRQGFKDRWVGTVAERKQCERIIDKFKQMDWAFLSSIADPARNPYALEAKEVVIEFKNLIERIQRRESASMPDSADCSNGDPNASNQERIAGGEQRPEEQEDSRKARERMQKQEKEQNETEEGGEDGSGHWDDLEEDDDAGSDPGSEDEEAGDDSGDTGNGSEGEDSDPGDSESASEDSEGDSGGEGSEEDFSGDDDMDGEEGDDSDESGEVGPAGGEGDDSDSDDELDSEGDNDSSGVGTDPNAPSQENVLTDEEFQEALDDIMDSLEDHKQLQEDIAQMRGALADPVIDLDEEIHDTYSDSVDEASRLAAVGVEREFSRLYAELEPGWNYGSDQGKLNAERWFRDGDVDDAFDEWDEGKQQDSGIEAVILLDTSSSMDGEKIKLACQSVWTLKRSFDAIEAKVTVITFDAKTRALYKRGETVNPHEVLVPSDLGGSTIPNMALHTARRILGESALPNKMLIAVTDGGWQSQYGGGGLGGEDETHEKILESIDALKLYFMIGGMNYRSIREYFDISRLVGTPTEIVPVVAEVVNHILEEMRNK